MGTVRRVSGHGGVRHEHRRGFYRAVSLAAPRTVDPFLL